ncbi:MAG: hypothetical protein DELT_01790 [Desulfovibrio sp.]
MMRFLGGFMKHAIRVQLVIATALVLACFTNVHAAAPEKRAQHDVAAEVKARVIQHSWCLYRDSQAKELAKKGAELFREGQLLASAAKFIAAYEKDWRAPYSYLAPALVLFSAQDGQKENAAAQLRTLGVRLAKAMQKRAPEMPRAPAYEPFYSEPPEELNDSVGVRIRALLLVHAVSSDPALRESYADLLAVGKETALAEEANHDFHPKQFIVSPSVPGIFETSVATWPDRTRMYASFGQVADWLLRGMLANAAYQDTVCSLFGELLARAESGAQQREAVQTFLTFADYSQWYGYIGKRPFSEALTCTFSYARNSRYAPGDGAKKREWYATLLGEAATVPQSKSRVFSWLAFVNREVAHVPVLDAPRILEAALGMVAEAFAFNNGAMPVMQAQDASEFKMLWQIFAPMRSSFESSAAYWRAHAEVLLIYNRTSFTKSDYNPPYKTFAEAARKAKELAPEKASTHYLYALAHLKDPEILGPIMNAEGKVPEALREKYFTTFWTRYKEVLARLRPGEGGHALSDPLYEPMDRGYFPPEKAADAFLEAVQRGNARIDSSEPANSPLYFAYVRLALRAASSDKRADFLHKALALENTPNSLSEGQSGGQWEYFKAQYLMAQALVRRGAQEKLPAAAQPFFAEARRYTAMDEHVAWVWELLAFANECSEGKTMEPCAGAERTRLYNAIAYTSEKLKRDPEIFPEWTKRPVALPSKRDQAVLGVLGKYAKALLRDAETQKKALLMLREALLMKDDAPPSAKPGGTGRVRAMTPFSPTQESTTMSDLLEWTDKELAGIK